MTRAVFVHGGLRLPALERGAPASQSEEAILRGFTEEWAGSLELLHKGSQTNRYDPGVVAGLFYAESASELGARLLRLLDSLGSTISSGRTARSRAVESFILKSSEKISESG